MKHVNILWTGGWDSTFRLCQLSRMDGVEVQPVYFSVQGYSDRTNWKKEIEAQDTLLPLLWQKEATKAHILDPIRLTDKDLPKDPDYRCFDPYGFLHLRRDLHGLLRVDFPCHLALGAADCLRFFDHHRSHVCPRYHRRDAHGLCHHLVGHRHSY